MSQEEEDQGFRLTIADLNGEIRILKEALKRAILDRARAYRQTIEINPGEYSDSIQWLPKVRDWAALCDMDLDQYEAHYFTDEWR